MREEQLNIGRSIAIGLVIYQPETSLLDRIQLAVTAGFRIYIYDNSPGDGQIRDYAKGLTNCTYLTCGKNAGLGLGISSVCAQAYYDIFSALIFFDQDTIFNLDTLEFIEDFYIKNKELQSRYSSIVFNSKGIINKDIPNASEVRDVLMTISSGSLFFLENLKRINWHNETYFVDCVDYEFCLNSDNNNLKIGEYSMTPGFDHITGQADSKYKYLGKERMLRKYSTGRMKDTVASSLRIFFTSLKTRNFKFARAIIRSLLIYLYFQFLVRFLTIINIKNG